MLFYKFCLYYSSISSSMDYSFCFFVHEDFSFVFCILSPYRCHKSHLAHIVELEDDMILARKWKHEFKLRPALATILLIMRWYKICPMNLFPWRGNSLDSIILTKKTFKVSLAEIVMGETLMEEPYSYLVHNKGFP